jgi:hypothetical protein
VEEKMRHLVWTAAMAAGFCVLVASGTSAQGKGKPAPPPPPVPVVAAISDVDPSTGQLMLLQSDGLGAYAPTTDISNQISGGDGDWDLFLDGQTTRTVRLTFDPIGTSPAGPSGYYNAHLISRCFDTDGTITGLLKIAEGSANTRCSLRIVFTVNQSRYFLVMSPMYAGTGWATASCPADTDSNTTCEQWTIVPGTGPNVGVASLYTVTKSNREAFVGSYNLSFRIDLTRQ